jgi:outer membrane protein assembly factor BamB
MKRLLSIFAAALLSSALAVSTFAQAPNFKWKYMVAKEEYFGVPLLLVVGPKGSVYASVLGTVYAFDPNDGTLRWKTAMPDGYYPTALATGGDDTLYSAAWDYTAWKAEAWTNNNSRVVGSGVYALDPSSGALKWKFKTDATAQALAVGSDGTVYAGSVDHKVYALDPASGALRWKFLAQAQDELVKLAVGSGGAIYASSWGRGDAGLGSVYALDPRNGALRWDFKARGAFDALAVGNNGTVYGAATVPTTGSRGQVYSLDPINGSVMWTFTADGAVNDLAVVNGSAVYAGSDSGVYALDPGSGAVRWKFATESVVSALAVGNDGAIYAGIYAIDRESGKPRWKFAAGFGESAVGHDGTIYGWSAGNVCAVIPP